MAKKAEKKVQGQSQKEEALRLKALAEQKFKSSDLQLALKYATQAHSLCPAATGVAEMLAAYRILDTAKSYDNDNSNPNWYRILDLEPFSHINSIKKQYKKLALVLHPDKNSLDASNDAFKLLSGAFHVLSDSIRRKEYDMKLRVAMQSAAMENGGGGEIGDQETFWTACSSCELRHKFEKKYVGQSLVCPNCRASFHAIDVLREDNDGGEEERTEGARSWTVGEKGEDSSKRKKVSSVNGLMEKSDKKLRRSGEHQLEADKDSSKGDTSDELSTRGQNEDDDLTLAGFQMLVKRSKKPKEGKKVTKQKEDSAIVKSQDKLPVPLPVPLPISVMNREMEIMTVEDSDFYDFDRDRGERSFKKGQVWAIYDDDDGMPRHYGLIDEVVSVNPFEVKMVWLDPQNKGEERLVQREKMGFHVACGSFKCFKMDSVDLVNIFSHKVNFERVAREIYRIYPTKGSVWALYNEGTMDIIENTSTRTGSRQYDMVVVLTSYCESYGLSLAYLEKVSGHRTVFKRREIGPSAVRRLEKDDVRLFSHQIPARRLCGDEFPDNLQNCWELDPAALPRDLLSMTL